MKKMILSLFTLTLMLNANTQTSIIGDWQGILEVQGAKLRIILHVQEADNGLLTTMDSPDQGASGIATESTTFENNVLKVLAPGLGLEYSGTLNSDGTKIEGTFKQGPMALPLSLSKQNLDKPKEEGRPQDPKSFPYKQEEVKIKNGEANVTLAGTLTLPEGEKPKAVAILVSGSGPQNRNEELANHRPFLVLSDYLTRRGIGVLRYDDRGVAESTGDHNTATSMDLAADAASVVAYLKTRKDLSGAKIGIIGHSEGGVLGPMVYSEFMTVDFLVLLAGPGIKSVDLLDLQFRRNFELSGMPAALVDLNSEMISGVTHFLKDNPEMAQELAVEKVHTMMQDGLEKFPSTVRDRIPDTKKWAEQESGFFLTPWFRYFITIDPAKYLSNVKCPVLALNGSLDYQVSSKENLGGIEKALKAANNKQYTIKELEGLNHLFQRATTGAGIEYGQIEETINEEVLKIVGDWIVEIQK